MMTKQQLKTKVKQQKSRGDEHHEDGTSSFLFHVFAALLMA
jgi:hypothetical protein